MYKVEIKRIIDYEVEVDAITDIQAINMALLIPVENRTKTYDYENVSYVWAKLPNGEYEAVK